MPIESFDRARFESVLPDGWIGLGVKDGEYTYAYPITWGQKSEVEIMIRSSVGEDGMSAGLSMDSIRIWLVDAVDRKPVAGKISHHISRVKGWDKRLLAQMRKLWKIGARLGTCERCNVGQVRLFTCKKDGPNHGKKFLTCKQSSSSLTDGCGYFEWMEEE